MFLFYYNLSEQHVTTSVYHYSFRPCAPRPQTGILSKIPNRIGERFFALQGGRTQKDRVYSKEGGAAKRSNELPLRRYFTLIVLSGRLNKINNPNAFQKKRSDYFHMSRNCTKYSWIKFNAEYNLIIIIACLHAVQGIVNSLFSYQFAVYSILWNFFIFN